MNTDVVDVREFAQHRGDQMEDHIEQEIVLDSDDEGGSQNNASNLVNGEYLPVFGRFSRRGATHLLKQPRVTAAKNNACDDESNARTYLNNGRYHKHHVVMDSVVFSSPDQKPVPTNVESLNVVRKRLPKDSLDERKLASHELESSNMKREANYDCEGTKLNYIESPEPSESDGKALDFVDCYLSVSDLGLSKDVEARKSDRTKSPPSLWPKGSHSLARRISGNDRKLMIFNWDGEQIEKNEYNSPRLNNDSVCGSEGGKSGYLSVNQTSNHDNLQKEKISSLQPIDRFPGKMSNFTDSDANLLNFNNIDEIGSYSEICAECDLVELNEHLEEGISRQSVETCEQLRLTLDPLDVGLDTQMAAEAMEALVHAAPILDACSVRQGSDNTHFMSSDTAIKKSRSNPVIYPEDTFVGWKCKEKRSRRVKISSVQVKNKCCSATKQFEIQRETFAQWPVNKKLRTRKELKSRDLEYTRNSKCGGPHEVNVKQVEHGFNERDSLNDFQKHDCLYGGSKEAIGVVESGSHPKQRKMISLHQKVHKMGVSGTCLKLNSDSSFEVKTDPARKAEKACLDVSGGCLSKFNRWNYPKGKRARQCTPHHSIRSRNQCSPCGKNMERYPIGNEEAHKRVEGLLVYTRQQKSSLQREHTSFQELAGHSCSPSVKKNQISGRQVKVSVDFDTPKPSDRFGALDDGKPCSVDAPGKMKSDELSNGHFMTLQVFEGNDKIKQPRKSFSRSPLMKELMRLGYTESLPDFLPKDSRRRRATENVCLLFSQNLKKSILKQQKKIVARLGFSIASCCSDATHFVTDRFVRTKNMLEAIALGKPVVTHLWLESCEQAGYVIHEKNYILRDEKKEKEIGFSMFVSLAHASQHPLLKCRAVLMTPNVKPGIDVITGLVKAVHGQVVQNMLKAATEDEAIPDDLLILSCEEDYSVCIPFMDKGASVYDSELLLNGIVVQKLEYERYELFKEFKKDRSPHLP